MPRIWNLNQKRKGTSALRVIRRNDVTHLQVLVKIIIDQSSCSSWKVWTKWTRYASLTASGTSK